MVVASLSSALYHYGFSAFFIPWRESFGWSRATLSGIISGVRLEGGLIGPVAGWAFDKFGPRRMMLLGLTMTGLGFLALSRVNSLTMLAIVYVGLLGAGSSLGTTQPVQVALANWFIRRRGRVIGLMTTGLGIGGSLVFLFALLIDHFGWRTGAVVAGLLFWVIGLPLAFVIRHRPEDMGLLPDGAAGNRTPPWLRNQRGRHGRGGWRGLADIQPRPFWMGDPRPEIDLTPWQALRAPAFWLTALTSACWSGVVASITVHLANFLVEETQVEYVAAVGFLSFFAATSLIGRIGFGFLADYGNVRLLLACLLVAQGVGLFLFSRVQSLAEVPFFSLHQRRHKQSYT